MVNKVDPLPGGLPGQSCPHPGTELLSLQALPGGPAVHVRSPCFTQMVTAHYFEDETKQDKTKLLTSHTSQKMGII